MEYNPADNDAFKVLQFFREIGIPSEGADWSQGFRRQAKDAEQAFERNPNLRVVVLVYKKPDKIQENP